MGEASNTQPAMAVGINTAPIDRAPDYTQNISPYFTADGKCIMRMEYWFYEQRALLTNEQDQNSPTWEALCICPCTGHLMYIGEGMQGFFYVNKQVQEAFVSWVTEQHLVVDST
jgi:hypothetical protein